MSRPQTRWFLDGAVSVLWWLAFVVLIVLWGHGYVPRYAFLVASAFQFGRLFTLYIVTGRLTGTAGSIAMERRL